MGERVRERDEKRPKVGNFNNIRIQPETLNPSNLVINVDDDHFGCRLSSIYARRRYFFLLLRINDSINMLINTKCQ